MNKMYKYPRTYHVPWSNHTNEDKVIQSMDYFINREVIVTEKLDGENWTIYKDGQHARSLEPQYNDYQSMLYSQIANFQYMIPDGWRICVEYMYAKHSIYYEDLRNYLYVTSIWNESNYCYPFNVTLALCKVFGLTTPNVIYKGIYNEDYIKSAFETYQYSMNREVEGYVIKRNEEFAFEDFSKYVAKWVRPNHVQTDEHWKYSKKEYNKLYE